jgi:ABC-type transport system substrate-binding protein
MKSPQEYGLIAESVEVPADLSYATFTLRPEARFHDGSPITADDVIWTFETLKKRRQRLSIGSITRISCRLWSWERTRSNLNSPARLTVNCRRSPASCR